MGHRTLVVAYKNISEIEYKTISSNVRKNKFKKIKISKAMMDLKNREQNVNKNKYKNI